MKPESVQGVLYKQLAEETGVSEDDVAKVLGQLGFSPVVENLMQVARSEQLERVSARDLRVEILLDKAVLVK